MKEKNFLEKFNITKKIENSNATISEFRTGIFAPIEKISANSVIYKNFVANQKKRSIQTSWGKTTIKGNILTQIHRDLLDCIFTNAKEIKMLSDGRVGVYFSTSNILSIYKGGSYRNTQWLKQKLDEIQTTAIEFSTADGKDFYSFSIISSYAYSNNHNGFGLVLTPEYQKFFEEQITINYAQELVKLLKVKSGLLRAVIRFFWTHSQNSKLSINALLEAIGFPDSSARAKTAAIKEIKDNLELLKNYGIDYEHKEMLFYCKSSFENKISFIKPKNDIQQLSLF